MCILVQYKMPQSRSKTQGSKDGEIKKQGWDRGKKDRKSVKLNVPQMDNRHRSSSMPNVREKQAKTVKESKEWPLNRRQKHTFKIKSVLECVSTGQWVSALGRVVHLKLKHPELTQADVNITCLFLFKCLSLVYKYRHFRLVYV